MVPGDYSQMRLRILDGRDAGNQFPDGTPYSYVLQDDGVIKPLEVPSNELKLDAFTIAANGLSAFTTEFDLRHSMVLPGHEEHYKLKPRGVRLVNNTEVATVRGHGGGRALRRPAHRQGLRLLLQRAAPCGR